MAFEFPDPTEPVRCHVEKPLLAALREAIDAHNTEKGTKLTLEEGASHYLNKALRAANGAAKPRRGGRHSTAPEI